jgi:hypothetical protein
MIADSTSSLGMATTLIIPTQLQSFLSGQECGSINNSKPLKGSRGSKENKENKEISIKSFVRDFLIDTPSGVAGPGTQRDAFVRVVLSNVFSFS